MSTNKAAVLKASNITVRFGGLKAVDDVSLQVYPGELVGLLGPNVAGNTTVLGATAGVVRPNAGQIWLDGGSLNGLPIHQRIGKGLGLSQPLVRPFREINLLDNVALAAGVSHTRWPMKALLHTSSEHERQIALKMLERVGIADYAKQMPGIQPLGVLKRMEVARALALSPRLLLLDEPLAGLNSREATTLANTIAELNQQGATIILIEHNLREGMRICQRLVALDHGRHIGEGEPQEVMSRANVRAAYLGTPANHESTEAGHA